MFDEYFGGRLGTITIEWLLFLRFPRRAEMTITRRDIIRMDDP